MGIHRLKPFVPILKVFIAVTIIYLMVQKGLLNLEDLFILLGAEELLVCLGLVFAGLYLASLRWMMLLRGQGFEANIRQVFSLQLVGLFFNYVFPGGVGGDLVKGYYLVKSHDNEKFLAGTSIVMDRVIGLWSLLMLAIFSGVFIYPDLLANLKLLYIYNSVIVASAILTLALGFCFSTRFFRSALVERITKHIFYGEFIYKSYNAVHRYGQQKQIIMRAILLSLGVQICSVIFFYVIGRSMDIPLSPWAYFFIVPLGFVCSSIPITPASIGIGQMVFLAIFNLYLGTKTQLGPNAISLFQIVSFLWGLIGGAIYLFKKRYTSYA